MAPTTQTQRTRQKFLQDETLIIWIEGFLINARVGGLSPGTQKFYRDKLKNFAQYCETQVITEISQITPGVLREYLLTLELQGHNPGGIHAFYRAVRTLLNWWDAEVEPEGWRNPTKRVRAPKVPQEPLEPARLETIRAILSTCNGASLVDLRDRAIILVLMDSGARANELLNLNIDDLGVDGSVLVRAGKGGKPRTVFIGKKTRQSIRRYLKQRNDTSQALWLAKTGEKLSYWGLRAMFERRATRAGVAAPTVHSFRRYFALECLRAGMDIFTLQRLMGHADLTVLRRYLAQTNSDLGEGHRRAGPVDNAGL